MLRRHMVRGIGTARLQEAARACEAAGRWFDAGRLWVASGAAYTQGDGLREALLGATSALKHVEHLRAARELESSCWKLLLFSANTGFKFGSEPVQALLAVGKTLMHGCPLIIWEDDASEPVLIQDHLGPTDDKAYLEAYKYKKLKQGEDPVQRVLYEHSLTYQGLSYNKQD